MRLSITHIWGGLPLYLLALISVGCDSGPAMTPIEGIVTLDGEPIEGATVLLEPELKLRPTIGITDASGKFSMDAYVGSNGVAIAKGIDLAAGSAEVETVATDEELESGEDDGSGEDYAEDSNELLTPAKYGSARTSGMTIDVQEGMAPVTLEMKSDG